MHRYLLLAAAIGFEVTATIALKATAGFSRLAPSILVVVGYVCSLGALGLALKAGLNISVGYAIWASVGTAAIAIAGVLLYHETLRPPAVLGIALIIVGVVLIHIGQ